ncbi:3-isopropylmalate/(R)-2-methylmalate dehydratase large subunit [Anoxynatronum buryatiense]|uniref:3-isopropylmalate dehydratase large subunit n=2 Tax=Anoxynatronum buryatiense TaxID=489973 RepID=A0AA45WX62_9CLOT|nr:3-isopropylmalate/(R)-2-methylmalate dehydratase large subunit [Anoxynatronum buryatiense]
MHAIEKIMARAAGVPRVGAGEIVTVKVDFAEVNDLYLQTIYSFREMGGTSVWDPEKICFVFDHYAPAPTIRSAQIHKEMRGFVKEQGLTHHFDINTGVCHQVMPEAGIVRPGMILVATDSHTTTHGAFGAFGTGVGATDMATILISGEMWMRVPEVMKIEINGTLPQGTLAKDVILHVMGQLGASAAVYKAIEFCGTYVEGLGVSDRMVLCNMAVEMGAKTAFMVPNEAVLSYVNQRYGTDFEVPVTDDDFEYPLSHVFDVSDLPPQVAVPHRVDHVMPIDQVEEVPVHQAFIGSCTGGRLEDIAVAADLLRGKQIHPDCRLVLIPASSEVFLEANQKGYIEDLMKAGATISTPGCGPCLGAHEGVIAEGEVCISATNRNFPGRMGSTGGAIYLGSPAVAAVSALTGKLTDPRKYWGGESV